MPAMTLTPARTTLIVAGIVLAAGLAVYLMGHPLICKCGYVKLWHFDVMSAENSQHLFDWYTPSHIIHGFIFYWLLWLVSRWIPMSLATRLILAVAIEAVALQQRLHGLGEPTREFRGRLTCRGELAVAS